MSSTPILFPIFVLKYISNNKKCLWLCSLSTFCGLHTKILDPPQSFIWFVVGSLQTTTSPHPHPPLSGKTTCHPSPMVGHRTTCSMTLPIRDSTTQGKGGTPSMKFPSQVGSFYQCNNLFCEVSTTPVYNVTMMFYRGVVTTSSN